MSKWINCTERLPPKKGLAIPFRYLIAVHTPDEGYTVRIATWRCCQGKDKLYFCWRGNFASTSHITHWMPLPELPK